uniref:Subtilisin-like protease fibronectin type-III domain-containing protein n=1 Tax=Fagus sylvatica TaxID=28930 RepID=A0A2N9EIW9_FAGSY
MGLSILPSVLLSYVVLFLLYTPTNGDKKECQLCSSCNRPEKAKESIIYSYTRHINGFAAMLDEKEAAEIASREYNIFNNTLMALGSKSSISFPKPSKKTAHNTIMGFSLDLRTMEKLPDYSAWKVHWPEAKSFADEGMGPIPLKWRGICQSGQKDGVTCNRKLIGVRYFNKGFAAVAGVPLNESFHTARDLEGHGSHTLSTAGGNFVPNASILNNANGTAAGGPPKARVAAYKVCWPDLNVASGCYDADILAAFDAAIADGVDVVSASLGGTPTEYFNDGISIGSFHAVKNGIAVVCSAGNDGPFPVSVAKCRHHGFSQLQLVQLDREVSLSASGLPRNKFYPIINAANANLPNVSTTAALLCESGSLDPSKVKGKILLCLRGDNGRVEKSFEALKAGAVGMILANNVSDANDLSSDPHVLPVSHINYTDGQLVFAYVNTTKNPTAYISPVRTQIGIKPAPVMAAFSSRGPNNIEPTILKPDITAPGVSILAAFTEALSPTELESDKRRFPFAVLSGTSMSCPHVSGTVGLLKTLHPDWSPAAIKSAVMTTAKTRDNRRKRIMDANNEKATPFVYGSGHMQPNRAMDPGLVYDITPEDYLNFLCARGYNDTLIRLFSEKPYECPGTYKVRVKQPAGVLVTVKPSTLEFKSIGEKKTFLVTLTSKFFDSRINDYTYGEMVWSDGKHIVRSPIAVNLSS